TARCWVCHRSSTACGTCRNFRRSVAAQLGYCGLDRHHLPLVGDEIRPCWEPQPAASPHPRPVGPPLPHPSVPMIDTPIHRSFIELDGAEASASSSTVPLPPPESRWSLWGDSET
ncbi:MAG: hypothetical protein ABJC39_12225, partial [Chloroflexota bacterium]